MSTFLSNEISYGIPVDKREKSRTCEGLRTLPWGSDEPVKNTDVVQPAPFDLAQGQMSEPKLGLAPSLPPHQCFPAELLCWDVKVALKADSGGKGASHLRTSRMKTIIANVYFICL